MHCFVFKVNGERESARYPVVISGRELDDDFFRWDGNEPDELLSSALRFVPAQHEG